MPNRPNVLLICTDHWPGALLGCEGHPAIQTPTLDQLAANGTRFTRTYSECPVCIPARRTLMTGTTPRTHGDRIYKSRLEMPDLPTLAGCFRGAGYQAYAVGKMHVFPQRDRVGFDDVILAEEARRQFGVVDDYQIYLGQQGLAGDEFAHGMCNNEHLTRPWHLDERHHVTNWATREMCRMIRRRDPKRPGLFYLSYCHPHPPLVPPQAYLDLYRDVEIPMPVRGDWADDVPVLSMRQKDRSEKYIRDARRAFYALCTHIDHQLRLVLGALREEGMISNTIIAFTCDHGDMLGDHGLWAKRCFYEGAARVPMIVAGCDAGLPVGATDDRLVGLADVMPTLLNAAGLDVPDTVEGVDMFGSRRREMLYGEVNEDVRATRMVTDGRYKLIWYLAGNTVQLFDVDNDPLEQQDLAGQSELADVQRRLTDELIANLYGGDEELASGGELRGGEAPTPGDGANWSFSGQRGYHWPPPMKFNAWKPRD